MPVILWPEAIAPFQLVVIPIDAHKSEQVVQASETLYQQAQEQGKPGSIGTTVEVEGILYDVRESISKKVCTGCAFNEADMNCYDAPDCNHPDRIFVPHPLDKPGESE